MNFYKEVNKLLDDEFLEELLQFEIDGFAMINNIDEWRNEEGEVDYIKTELGANASGLFIRVSYNWRNEDNDSWTKNHLDINDLKALKKIVNL